MKNTPILRSTLRNVRTQRRLAWPVMVAASLPMITSPGAYAQALPSGGVVSAGKATIGAPGANAMLIMQDSQRAVLNWSSFGIAKGNTVTFAQPNAGAATLNVVSGALPSDISGTLKANGSVFLINRNGIAIGASGVVDTRAGFVASTLGMSEDDFMAGKASFAGKGGAVVNRGRIVTGPGGQVALLGGSVSNEGTIIAPLGKVALGSGEAATLDLSGDGYLQVMLPATAVAADGQPLVNNSGEIDAAGGVVMLKAATVAQAVREAVHMPGTIRARSVSGHDGAIVLEGGDGGAVRASGTLDASAQDGAASGGRIDIGGAQVALVGASLDASGEQRGGLVRVGGSFQGGKAQAAGDADAERYVGRFGAGALASAPANAASTAVDAASRIDVSARGADGVGGSAIVWSDKSTVMRGSIAATGAASAGVVEVSSASTVQSAALGRIALGKGGKLLLDPQDIQIDDSQPGEPVADIGYGGQAGAVTHLYSGDLTALLGSGTSVSLKASQDIVWSTFNATVAHPFGVPAGGLNLSAGRSVMLSGSFSTGDANWSIVANDTAAHGVVDAERGAGRADIDLGFANFINSNGGLTMTLADGAGNSNRDAGNIRVGGFSGNALSASIAPGAAGNPKIMLMSDVDVAGTISLSGNLQVANSLLTLSGKQVVWTNEGSATITGEGMVKFVEDGVTTRFGRLGGSNATRLALGDGVNAGVSRIYGDADPSAESLGTPLLHLQSGTAPDALADILAAGSIAATGPGAAAHAGAAELSLGATGSLAFGSGLAGSYFIDLAPVTLPLTIERRVVTPAVGSRSGTYGTAIAAVTLGNVVNGDALAPLGALNGGASQALSAANGGFGFGTAPAAGVSNYTVTGLAGAAASDYVLAPGSWNGSLDVAPKALNYYAFHADQVYGDAALPAASVYTGLTGVLAGDSVDAIAGITLNGASLPGKLGAGNYLYTVVGLSGAGASNYTLAASGNQDWAFTVAPRPLDYTVATVGTTYGTAAALGALTLNNVLAGDQVAPGTVGIDAGGARAGAVTSATPAGTYAQTITSLGGADAANYTLAGAGAGGYVTVAPKPLLYTGAAVSQEYGQQLRAPALTGIINGDEVSGVNRIVTLSFSGDPSPSHLPVVGTYRVGYSGLSGAGAGNYVLAAGSVDNIVSVTPKMLTYAAGSANLTYGDGGVLTGAIAGILPGEEASVGSYAYVDLLTHDSSVVDVRAPAGSYAVKVALDPSSNNNYMLATDGNTPGRLVITPRAVNWQVGNGSAQYGDVLNNTVSLTNLLAGDTVTPLVQPLDANGAGIPLAGVGSYLAGVTALGGAAGGNYTLATTGNTTGLVNITPRQLQLVVNASQSVYGTLPAAAVSLNGVLPGDVAGFQTQTQVSQGGNAVQLSDRLPAGSYTVDASVQLNGNPNYALAANSGSATLTVTPRPLSYTGPTGSYEYGTAVRDMNLASTLNGVLDGDIVTLPAILSGDWAGPDKKRPVGYYGFPVSLILGLSGRDAANYTVGMAGSSDGLIQIIPKTLTWKTLVDGLPSHEYGVLGRGLVVNADVSPAYAGDDVHLFGAGLQNASYSTSGYLNAGSYATTPGSLTGVDAGNYRLATTGNEMETVTVVPRGVSASPVILAPNGGALSSSLVYGSTAGTHLGLAAAPAVLGTDKLGVDLSFLLPGGANATLPDRLDAGSYDIAAALSGADARNYYLQGDGSGVVGKLDVARRPVSVSYPDLRTTYGSLQPLIPTLNGVLAQDGDLAAVGELRNGDDFPVPLQSRTGAGTYSYLATGLVGGAANNYVLTQQGASWQSSSGQTVAIPAGRGASVVIDKLPLTVSYNGPTTMSYGAVPGAIAVSGVLAGDSVGWSDVLASAGGSVMVRNDVYQRDRVDAGTYDYKVVLDAGAAGNYAVPSRVAGVTIEKVKISGQVRDTTIEYRDPNGTVRLSSVFGQIAGALPGEGLTGIVGYFDASGKQIQYDPRLPAGSYEARIVSVLGGVSANPNNYQLDAADNAAGKLTITPIQLTLNLPETLKAVYGSSPIFGRNAGIYADDQVSFVLSGGGLVTQALSMSDEFTRNLYYDRKVDAGDYTYKLELQGAAAGNYALAGRTGGQLSVTPKALGWTVTPGSGQYGYYKDCDGYAGCTLTPGVDLGKPVFTGLVPGDTVGGTVTVLDLQGTPMVVDANTPVGNYFQVVSSLTGAAAKNYQLATSGNLPGTLTINPLWLRWSTTSSVNVLGGYGEIGNGGEVTLSAPGGVSLPHGETVGATSSIYLSNRGTVPLGTALPAGRYYYVADQLTGPFAGNYRLMPVRPDNNGVPMGQADVGVYDVYGDGTLGLNLVNAKDLPTVRPPLPDTVYAKSAGTGSDAKSGLVLGPIKVNGKDDGDPGIEFGRVADDDGVRTEAGVTIGLTGVRAGAEVGAAASGAITAGPVTIEAQASATAEALAKFGVTGVTVSAGADGHVDITISSGPVDATVGLQGAVEAQVKLGTSGVKIGADATVGAYAGANVSGTVVPGVTGSVGATGGTYAYATTNYQYGMINGVLTMANSTRVGTAATGSLTGTMQGEAGNVAGGATVYAGAVVGGTASVGGGYSGGVVSVSIDIGLQLGIGVDLKLDFGVNVGAAGSMFSSLVNTSGPGMIDRQASADLHGLELKKDPAARFAYLSSNSEWNYMGKSSAENSAFLRDYGNLLTATQRMYDDQKNWQATFLQLLKTDPTRAVEYSRTKPDFRQQQIEILRTATRLGVTLKVVDGAVKYVSSGGL